MKQRTKKYMEKEIVYYIEYVWNVRRCV